MQDLKKESGAIAHAVENTVSKLREEVLDRIVREKALPQAIISTGPNLAELEGELTKLETRLLRWRLRREGNTTLDKSDTRFVETNEKRAVALRAAIERLKVGDQA
jgi:hypothetical protein